MIILIKILLIMQLRHWKSCQSPNDGLQKVTSLCWSPDGKKIALASVDRIVSLFDDEGNKKDKFQTKPATEKGPKTYMIKDMIFSPSSDRLALAQSDNIVYVYKIGTEWGEKKSISNKFQHSSPINCIVWPSKRPQELVYGLADGSVRIGSLKSGKPTLAFQCDSYVTALACNRDGDAFVSAHLDGSLFVYFFEHASRGGILIARHTAAPFALAWGMSIVVAGNDGQIFFYTEDGGVECSFDVTENNKQLTSVDINSAVTNPAGDAVLLGGHNCLFLYCRGKNAIGWEQVSAPQILNLYSVSSLDWKPDGGKVAVGTVCGAVELLDISLKRLLLKGKFEVTNVSASQATIKNIEDNSHLVMRSKNGYEINNTNIYNGRYALTTTTDSIIVGDMLTSKTSEVKWTKSVNDKFIFDNEFVCVIYASGEVSLIEYGVNDFLAYFRTSFVNRHVFCVRIHQPSSDSQQSGPGPNTVKSKHVTGSTRGMLGVKKVAYLMDPQTICIKDLNVQSSNVVIDHRVKIDWLMLNEKATLLLFRDKSLALYMVTLASQAPVQLLSHCGYVQWVPHSDVVVAQSCSTLCVWYNMNAPGRVTEKAIKGTVEEIERGGGQTLVIVDEGTEQAVYPLDEALISFTTFIESQEYISAMQVLENLEVTADVEDMWRQLYKHAIENEDLYIAIRAAKAVGNTTTANYLSNMQDSVIKAMNEDGSRDTLDMRDHYLFRAKMALLRKDLPAAEAEYLSNGHVNECIAMYEGLMKFDSAIRVAEQTRHVSEIDMKRRYFDFLLETKQYDLAAQQKEKSGDYIGAIDLYLKANLPGKAARIVLNRKIYQPMQLLESILTMLTSGGIYEIAGEMYEYMDDYARAIDSYERGNDFKRAVDLARKCFPGRVVELQEKWGDSLAGSRQVDMAINHYIEAKAHQKAIEAALSARLYPRALQLINALESGTAKPYYVELAKHYEVSGQFDLAEKCFLASGDAGLAVSMHGTRGNWDVAFKLASTYMSPGEIGLLYINHAQRLEAQGRLQEAERLYITVQEYDMAIAMYKRHQSYKDVVRLVSEHRPDSLQETHQYIAHALEAEGVLRDAETHYVEAGEWQNAVNMYRGCEQWDDSIRVAKTYGGSQACKRMALALLIALGVANGSKFLIKHGLLENAIEHATESGSFDIAFEIANLNMVSKLPEIHLRHAIFLEDAEKYTEAEHAFMAADKPREAIDMYIHVEDWTSALRVAENADPAAIPDIFLSQAKLLHEAHRFTEAEDRYIQASRPDLALDMYKSAGMYSECMKITQSYLPHLVTEVSAAFQSGQFRNTQQLVGTREDALSVGKAYESAYKWQDAVDLYLAGTDDDIILLERAVDVAKAHLPNKAVEVVLQVSKRLVKHDKEEVAATFLRGIGRHEDAIDICLQAKKFDTAKEFAKGNPTLTKRVTDTINEHLTAKEDANGLLVNGRVDAALDVLAKRGDWARIWEITSREGVAIAITSKYVLLRVAELLGLGNTEAVDEAVRLLNTHPILASDTALPVLRNLTVLVVARALEAQGPGYLTTMQLLRESLYRLTVQLTSGNTNSLTKTSIQNDLSELLMCVHYQYTMQLTQSLGLTEIAAKCAITLLKYPFIIPQDKTLYQAGMLCRDVKATNLAFLLLNR